MLTICPQFFYSFIGDFNWKIAIIFSVFHIDLGFYKYTNLASIWENLVWAKRWSKHNNVPDLTYCPRSPLSTSWFTFTWNWLCFIRVKMERLILMDFLMWGLKLSGLHWQRWCFRWSCRSFSRSPKIESLDYRSRVASSNVKSVADQAGVAKCHGCRVYICV